MVSSKQPRISAGDWDYATGLVLAVCKLAGPLTLIDDLQAGAKRAGITAAVENHDTAALFPWLLEQLCFQGIADTVALGYMDRHGTVTAAEMDSALHPRPSCPKLATYWTFYGCGFRKSHSACKQPEHYLACPLPRAPMRNGSLNQLAYSLF